MEEHIKKFNRGSEWRKWDLHLHSKYSLEDRAKLEITDIFKSAIEKGISVISVTDHTNVDGLDEVWDLWEHGEVEIEDVKITIKDYIDFLPGIELRTDKGKHSVHIVVVFPKHIGGERVDKKFLIENFLAKINSSESDIKKSGNSQYKDGLLLHTVDFEETSKKVRELGGLLIVHAGSKSNGIEKEISHQKDDADTFEILNSLGTKKEELMRLYIDICEVPNREPKNIKEKDFYLKTFNKPTLLSSDSHEGYTGEFYTWIKADPTFDGLKQILCEPESRISINKEKPIAPINTIDSIKFNIPEEAKADNEVFCFSGITNEFHLSPYFNCFIGGRGAGKSTILNFLGIRSNDLESSKRFWFGDKDRKGINPAGFKPDDDLYFKIKGTPLFEYLAQSEIENFAREKSKFTEAIYDRANGPNKLLQIYEDRINSLKQLLDSIIDNAQEIKQLKEELENKQKQKISFESVNKILESDDYKEINDNLTQVTKEIQTHNKWKNEVDLLKTQLEDTVDFYFKSLREDSQDQQECAYRTALVQAKSKLEETIKLLGDENFTSCVLQEKENEEKLKTFENKLRELLKNFEFSDENTDQITQAPQKIVSLNNDIDRLNLKIEAKQKELNNLDQIIDDLKRGKEEYEIQINEIIKPLQEILKKQFDENKGQDIKQISLEYVYDETIAYQNFLNQFYNYFKERYHSNEKVNDIERFFNENKSIFLSDDIQEIKSLISTSTSNNKVQSYRKFLAEVFDSEENFIIYKAIRASNLYDVKSNKQIQVKYDNKDLSSASFGQRCTAVIVILLLFGNYPLLIDEPEAHLDSSLIANYLVPLLKKNKLDRQIIFATHNANFVINGDCEKIFILKNDDGRTNIIETSIENLENRIDLLRLEGGEEAFKKRGEKLNIK